MKGLFWTHFGTFDFVFFRVPFVSFLFRNIMERFFFRYILENFLKSTFEKTTFEHIFENLFWQPFEKVFGHILKRSVLNSFQKDF